MATSRTKANKVRTGRPSSAGSGASGRPATRVGAAGPGQVGADPGKRARPGARTKAKANQARTGRSSSAGSGAPGRPATRVGAAGSGQAGKRPTLKTIAELANLGVTTVSRALKDAPEIGAATKRRVNRIARDLGYQPDRAGVRLRTGRTNVLSLVLNPHEEVFGYGTSMISGISQALQDTPYHLVVTPHFLHNDPMEPIRYIIATGAADGILLSQTQPQDQRVRYLLERNFPFVCHGRTELATPHPFHDFDNYAFAFAAAKRLTEKGRRRLCILAPPVGFTFHNHMMMGFERAVHQFGAVMVAAPGINIRTSPQEIRCIVREMMAAANAPDGFICGGDISALALTAGLRDAGLMPGRDADLVAKQTSPVLDHTTPAIDTLFEDLTASGYVLASLLIRRLQGEPVATLQSISEPEARFRTDCPAQAAPDEPLNAMLLATTSAAEKDTGPTAQAPAPAPPDAPPKRQRKRQQRR